jgi:hypothetical protein
MRLFSHFRRMLVLLSVTVIIVPALAQCYGGFVLTRKWHGFISGINNKWLRWIVFLITCIVYGITIWVDAIIFNSIEFWSGSNPMAHSDFDENGQFVKVEERSGEKVVFTYRDYGEQLRIDMYKDGRYKGNLVLLRAEPGQFYSERDGRLLPVDVSEDATPTGRVVSMRVGEEITRREIGLLEYYALRAAVERSQVAPTQTMISKLYEADGRAPAAF